MRIRIPHWRRALVGATLAGAAALAQAGTFNCISGSVADCGLAESSLSWTWNGQDFTIANAGTGYVSEVYFDLGAGMSVSFLGGFGDVNFTLGAQPGSLPAGGSVGFVSDTAFDSDSGQGQPTSGINTGETATFRVLGGSLGSIDAGTLAAGIHVRSLVSGSASLVSTTGSVVTPVPEPESYAMALAGFAIIALGARSRRKS
jgi:hypothetical protein